MAPHARVFGAFVVISAAILAGSTYGDITRQIGARFSKTAQLARIDVRTDDGVVTLRGAAPSIGASARASELARGVSGVRAVRNELTYGPARRDR